MLAVGGPGDETVPDEKVFRVQSTEEAITMAEVIRGIATQASGPLNRTLIKRFFPDKVLVNEAGIEPPNDSDMMVFCTGERDVEMTADAKAGYNRFYKNHSIWMMIGKDGPRLEQGRDVASIA